MGGSPVEDMVDGARRAATLDSIDAALASGHFDGAILATDDPALAPDCSGVIVDVYEGPFHFGSRLEGLLRSHSPEAVVYLGGGSLPLLGADDFASLTDELERADTVVTNNRYSSDLVAFRVGALSMEKVSSSPSDNALARALSDGMDDVLRDLPRTVATLLDIDGPADLAVMALSDLGGQRLGAYLQELAPDTEPYRRLLPLFVDRHAQVVVAGRVGSHAWQYLERETACRVRLFAEERGMQADGREEARGVRSILGFFLEAAGTTRFFDVLAELGDAALIDSRVMFAHLGLRPTREERFLSDMGRWSDLPDGILRELTRGAVDAPFPVLLGGHSLVSGDLMALNEFAWQENEKTDTD
jgi:hypothetical protein